MTLATVFLILLAILALILLVATIVSYLEFRQRRQQHSETSELYALLDSQFQLKATATDAQKEMLREFCRQKSAQTEV